MSVATKRGQRRQIRTKQLLEMLGYSTTDQFTPHKVLGAGLASNRQADLVPSKLFFEELQSCCDALVTKLILVAQDVYALPIQSLIKKQTQLRLTLFYHLIIETAREDGSLDLMLHTARNLEKVFNIVQRTIQRTGRIPSVEKFVQVAKQMAVDGLSDTGMPSIESGDHAGDYVHSYSSTSAGLPKLPVDVDIDDAFRSLVRDALNATDRSDDKKKKVH